MEQRLSLSPTEIKILLRMASFKELDYIINSKREKFRKVETPELISMNGWLTKEQIECSPCPYNNPQSDRWEYLNRSLNQEKEIIQIDKFDYIDNRGRKASEKVYRINPDMNTFIKIFNYFYIHKYEDESLINKFIESDYFKKHRIYESISVLIYSNIIIDKGYGKDRRLISQILGTILREEGKLNEISIIPHNLIYHFINGKIKINPSDREMKIDLYSLIKSYLIISYKESSDETLKIKYKDQILNLSLMFDEINKKIETEVMKLRTKKG